MTSVDGKTKLSRIIEVSPPLRPLTELLEIFCVFERHIYVMQSGEKFNLWVQENYYENDFDKQAGRLLGTIFTITPNVFLYFYPLLDRKNFECYLTEVLRGELHGNYAFRITAFNEQFKKDLRLLISKGVARLLERT